MPEPNTSRSVHLDNAKEWRAWLRKNGKRENEIWLVSYKKATGKPAIAYQDALEEAICFGWVDTLIRRIDDERFATRWMPRRPDGTWSKTNLALAERLIDEGRMTKAGLATLGEVRTPVDKPPVTKLDPDAEAEFRMNKRAWAFFQSLTPGYRKRYLSWIGDAKRPGTRRRRIAYAKRELAKGVKSLVK